MKKPKKSKFFKVMPFIPLVVTFLFYLLYLFMSVNNVDISLSPFPSPPELPQLNPPQTVYNYSLIIIGMFVVSIIFMVVVFYYLTKRDYYS